MVTKIRPIAGFIAFLLILLQPVPGLDADTSFDCSSVSGQLVVHFDIPSVVHSYKLEFTVDPASAADSGTFNMAYPGGSEDLDFSVGSSGSELVGTVSDDGSGHYTLEILKNPNSLPYGELPSGNYTLTVSGLNTSSPCRIFSTSLSAKNTGGFPITSPSYIAFDPCSAPTLGLAPSGTTYTLNVAVPITAITVTTNDPDNPPADLSMTVLPPADSTNLSVVTSTGQAVGTFTYTPSGADYVTGVTSSGFDITFTGADKDNSALSTSESIHIDVVNEAPDIALVHTTGQQVYNDGSGRWEIGSGDTLQIAVTTTDENPPATLGTPAIVAVPALTASSSWTPDEPNGSGTFTFIPALSDQGKDFTVTFTAVDKDNPTAAGMESTETVNVTVPAPLPATLEVSPASLTFNVPVGQSQDQTVTLSNQSVTEITASLELTAAGAIEGLAYEETDNGYFAASFDIDLCAPDVSSPVSFNNNAILNVRYVALREGVTPVKSVTILRSDSTAFTVISLGGTSQAPDPRDPFSNIAVLDKSGSMRRESEISGVTKMEALKTNSRMFYKFMENLAGGNDKIGVIKYNQNADFADNIDLDLFPGSIGSVENFINNLSAQGSTSISRAVKKAILQLTADEDFSNLNRNNSILLMTDGRHNTPSTDFDQSFSEDGALVNQSDLQQIKLHVVGYGQEGDLQAGFLQNLCESTFGPSGEFQFKPGGKYRHTTDNKKLGIYFVQILLDDYFTAQVCVDDEGEIRPGSQSVETLYLTRSTEKAVFYLTWSDPGVRLYFRLIGPGSEKIPDICETKEGYAIASLDFPYLIGGSSLVHKGGWLMQVFAIPVDIWEAATDANGRTNIEQAIRASLQYRDDPQTPTILYEAALVTKDPPLQAEFDIEGIGHNTGEELMLTTRLVEGSAPLLNADEVQVSVTVPTESLGDFIYNNDISGDVTAAAAGDIDSGDSPATLKLAALLEEHPELLTKASFVFPMRDDGTNGDAQADDGIYTVIIRISGTNNYTEHNGVYTFKFKAGGTTCLGDRFYRTKTFSEYISSIPVQEHSQISYHYVNKKQARVSVVLKDKFEHNLAPIVGRTYMPFPQKPGVCDFKVTDSADLLNGEWVFTLHSPDGSFKPYMKAGELIELQVAGLNMPEVNLPAEISPQRCTLELFGGWSAFSSNIPIRDSLILGARARYPLGLFFSLGAEMEYARTTDTQNTSGQLLQYGLTLGWTLPFIFYQMQLYLCFGGGRTEFIGFTNGESVFSANVGAGFKLGFNWRRRTGLSFEVRDALLFGAYGSELTNNLQFLVGLYW